MAGEERPRKRGRPAKPEEERRRHNLTFRIRSDLRELLERDAAQAGRSISEEIELRLERSFDREATALEAFGGSDPKLMRSLTLALQNLDGPFDSVRASRLLSAIGLIVASSGKSFADLQKECNPLVLFVVLQFGLMQANQEANIFRLIESIFPEVTFPDGFFDKLLVIGGAVQAETIKGFADKKRRGT